jgi:Holliday junction DNA helicase RuvA
MWNSISGEITHKDGERVFLQAGGLEWEIAVSRKSSEKLPEVGSAARVYTYLLHREDQMRIHGFADAAERALFLDLLKVDGVGPRAAMKILSGIDRSAFTEALDKDDVDALSAVPGIGRKTAQKIILSLKGKLSTTGGSGTLPVEEDITAALVGMGYERKAARAAVSSAMKSVVPADVRRDDLEREVFKKAIAIVSGKEAAP